MSEENDDEMESRSRCPEYHGGDCSGRCKLFEHVGDHVCDTCREKF